MLLAFLLIIHRHMGFTLNTVLGSSFRFTRVTTRPEVSSTSKMLAL